MAEWIGHFMNGWPTWAIGIAIVIIAAVAIGIYWITYLDSWVSGKREGKRTYGKK